MKTYKSYSLRNYIEIPQIENLSRGDKKVIEIIGSILPFKTNNYVIDKLINWENIPNDPIYTLTFPRKEMLKPEHFDKVEQLISSGKDKDIINNAIYNVRMELNPHPAGQKHNVPKIDGIELTGVQHKYRETVLFFPSQGQTCHAYCTFCFRWPQFVKSGKNLAIMAHFNHPIELSTNEVRDAMQRIRSTGAQIRSQSPLLKHISDSSAVWADMWGKQVNLNCIPYYMFLARDTGAQHFFEIPLVDAWEIFRNAYQRVSGVCRTVRGPSMSATPGKVQVLGISEVNHEKVMVLRFLQGRIPDWAARPFFAKYDNKAVWLSQLKPAFGEEKFFFEEELDKIFHEHIYDDEWESFE